MDHQVEVLQSRIKGLDAEIGKLGITLEVESSDGRYRVKLSKGGQEVGAYLEQQDVKDCLAGKKCLNLAATLTQLRAELQDLLTPRPPG